MTLRVEVPSVTDRIPEDIVDWIRDADVCELDVLAGLVHKEMQVRVGEQLHGDPERTPSTAMSTDPDDHDIDDAIDPWRGTAEGDETMATRMGWLRGQRDDAGGDRNYSE